MQCEKRTELYRCSESQDSLRAAPAYPPVEPLKRGDVPTAAGQQATTLHLLVSNQSQLNPTMTIPVRIDSWRVADGEFAFADGSNWYAFDIQVPLGARMLSVQAYDEKGGVSGQETIDVRTERWLRIAYRRAIGELGYVSIEVTDQPSPP